MKAVGIVCELNPIHAGHIRLIEETKKHFGREYEDVRLVGAMSSCFVQRGRPSVLDPWTRAKMAVSLGFDLIVEIPQAYVLQSASGFAYGGVKCLSMIDKVDSLAFSAEDSFFLNDPDAILEKYKSKNVQSKISDYMKSGLSYRQAHERALDTDLMGNQIMAYNYLLAIERLSLNYDVFALKRESFDGEADPKTSSTSASAIRRAMAHRKLNPADLPAYSLIKSGPFSDSLDPFYDYLKLRKFLDPIDWTQAAHHEKGMEDRLYSCMENTNSLEKALSLAANKRQTKSRYRRMILSALLGIKKNILPEISYIRPLAFNEKGREILNAVKCPIIQKKASDDLNPESLDLLEIEKRAHDLYYYINGLDPGLDKLQKYYFPNSSIQ